jgi:hypothetical protein
MKSSRALFHYVIQNDGFWEKKDEIKITQAEMKFLSAVECTARNQRQIWDICNLE